jgi:hypothetical protein
MNIKENIRLGVGLCLICVGTGIIVSQMIQCNRLKKLYRERNALLKNWVISETPTEDGDNVFKTP